MTNSRMDESKISFQPLNNNRLFLKRKLGGPYFYLGFQDEVLIAGNCWGNCKMRVQWFKVQG